MCSNEVPAQPKNNLKKKKKERTVACYNMDESCKIMLSERSWGPKIIHFMIPFLQNVKHRQIHRDKKYIGGFLQLGEAMRNEGDC